MHSSNNIYCCCKYGYWSKFTPVRLDVKASLCVAAHPAHVSFAGRRLANSTIVPRYSITLASAVDADTRRQVNLEYMDPRTFCRKDYEGDADTLVVEQAGRDLYLVAPLSD